jgi:hypothetical protein
MDVVDHRHVEVVKQFYASLGPNIENKEIQITVQGQTISSNFGL